MNSNNTAMLFARSSAGDESNVTGTTITPEGQWVHLVAVYTSATDRKLYLNGVLEATDTVSIPFVAGNSIAVGVSNRSSQFGFWKNAIDEARLYNRALTVAEVKQLYLQGK